MDIGAIERREAAVARQSQMRLEPQSSQDVAQAAVREIALAERGQPPIVEPVWLPKIVSGARGSTARRIVLRAAISLSLWFLWGAQRATYRGSGYSKSARDLRSLHSCLKEPLQKPAA